MNYRMVFYTTGRIMFLESALLVLPFAVSLLYQEACAWSLFITLAIAAALGTVLTLFCKPKTDVIYAKEGFVIVALVWVALSAVGALPFVISGEIPSYFDAFFETVSGFTTTGASILTDVESMSHGLLFWRSFTHWVGGMGVLVFIISIAARVSERSIHILRAEMSGPVVGKLVPRARDTATILYLIYIAMTILEMVFLLLGGMPWFDSTIHAFGTAGTGGFGIRADSIAGYSPYLQWVIAIFMLLFGINFNLYYLILVRRFRSAWKNLELWVFLGIVGISSLLIGTNLYFNQYTLEESARLSVFQVSSLITTTGYATADFNLWPGFSKTILFLLMFIGGCAGSTAGGLKVSRVIILVKSIRRELRRLLHPRTVSVVRMEGKKLEDSTVSGVAVYFALYALCLLVVFLLLGVEPFDLETNLTAAVSCFNNIGPGFGSVGPASSYAAYSNFSKVLLSAAMLFGRLEIYPILLMLAPSTWSKRQ